jgi:hypothetical protein
MTERQFRGLIVMHWVLIIGGAVVAVASERYLPLPLKSYVDSQTDTLWSDHAEAILIVSLLYLAITIAVYVGLFFFKGWAKKLYLPVLLGGMAVTASMGPTVELGPVSTLGDCLMLIEGVILSAIFFTPLADLFGRTGDPSTDPPANPGTDT